MIIRLRALEIVQGETLNSATLDKPSATVKPPSLFDWYCILRAQHHWTVFQAIRFALWLAR
jgi:hypothetical protein